MHIIFSPSQLNVQAEKRTQRKIYFYVYKVTPHIGYQNLAIQSRASSLRPSCWPEFHNPVKEWV